MIRWYKCVRGKMYGTLADSDVTFQCRLVYGDERCRMHLNIGGDGSSFERHVYGSEKSSQQILCKTSAISCGIY